MENVRKKTQKSFFAFGKQVFSGSHSDSIGKRPSMEDACVAFGEVFGPNTQYYGLFDGHGGSSVSVSASSTLHLKFQEKYNGVDNIDQMIQDCINEWNNEAVSRWLATGSTAAIVLIIGDLIVTANIGDTRIIIIDGDSHFRCTKDHNVQDPEEVQAIISRGGVMFNERVNGLLSLTRSLGDGSLKGIISHEAYITYIQRNDNMKLIIACDGIWEVMSDEDAVDIFLKAESPSAAAKQIKDEALKRGTTDNVSVMCINMKPK